MDSESKDNFELDETASLKEAFCKDLTEVFGGKEAEFGDRLQGMLFELWMRARVLDKNLVQELEQLRQLKGRQIDLQEMVRQEFQSQIDHELANYFDAEFEKLLSQHLKKHVADLLKTPAALDEAIVTGLTRVLEFDSGIEGVSTFPDRLTIKHPVNPSVSPSVSPSGILDSSHSEIITTTSLQSVLEGYGLVVPTGGNNQWVPLHVNSDTGGHAIFKYGALQELPKFEEVQAYLVWRDGVWLFPNPKPASDGMYPLELCFYVDGTRVVSDITSFLWCINWEFGHLVAISVSNIPEAVTGTEVVSARYKVRKSP